MRDGLFTWRGGRGRGVLIVDVLLPMVFLDLRQWWVGVGGGGVVVEVFFLYFLLCLYVCFPILKIFCVCLYVCFLIFEIFFVCMFKVRTHVK